MENEVIDGVEPQVEEKIVEKEVDPYVEKAIEMGWRPEEEWDGDPADFVDAKEFVRRQPLFDKISGLSKTVKQLEGALEAFKIHHSRVKENEYNRALEQLKQAKRQALSEGETNQALHIEDKIDEIENQRKEFEKEMAEQARQPSPDPSFTNWLKVNSWYQKDRAMTAFADSYAIDLKNKGYSNDEILEQLSKEIRVEFKHKFTNPRRDAPSAVEAGSRKSAKNTVDNITAGMSEQDIQIMNRIVKSGTMTKEQYLKEYQRVQGN